MQRVGVVPASPAGNSCCLHIHCRFWHFVSQPPVRIFEVPDESEQDPILMEAPRFMAVVWGANMNGDGPTTLVQLDGQGRPCAYNAAATRWRPATVVMGCRQAAWCPLEC